MRGNKDKPWVGIFRELPDRSNKDNSAGMVLFWKAWKLFCTLRSLRGCRFRTFCDYEAIFVAGYYRAREIRMEIEENKQRLSSWFLLIFTYFSLMIHSSIFASPQLIYRLLEVQILITFARCSHFSYVKRICHSWNISSLSKYVLKLDLKIFWFLLTTEHGSHFESS